MILKNQCRLKLKNSQANRQPKGIIVMKEVNNNLSLKTNNRSRIEMVNKTNYSHKTK